jgi:hypothetical protein
MNSLVLGQACSCTSRIEIELRLYERVYNTNEYATKD